MVAERQAAQLLRGLVEIPSLSGQERAASEWLTGQMAALGFDRVEVDAVGNAVGEIGPEQASRIIMLLGHIDTVPGEIPVAWVACDDDLRLNGRGAVDAKGSLANFVVSAANVRDSLPPDCRIVVVGAVEEEAATSRGARRIRDRFNGLEQPVPRYCVIGEPSGAHSIARGYKGRLLLHVQARQPTAHTAGPGTEIAELVVDYWNWLCGMADLMNVSTRRTFDRVSPSLREFETRLWDEAHNHARCLIGLRLPLGFQATAFVRQNVAWLSARIGAEISTPLREMEADRAQEFHFEAGDQAVAIRFSGFEPAWLTPRRNALCRSLQGAIRGHAGRQAQFTVKTGTSDMNVVGPAWQCPVVAYGPGDSLLDHTPDEHLMLSEYHASNRILTQALRSLLAALQAGRP